MKTRMIINEIFHICEDRVTVSKKLQINSIVGLKATVISIVILKNDALFFLF